MTTASRKASHWPYLLPLILGLLMLVPGIESYKQSRYLLAHGQSATGEVIAIDKIRVGSGGQPVIRFNTGDNRQVQKVFDDPLGGRYRIGERVPIIYDPQHPLAAKINSSYGLYAHIMGTTAMCVMCWSTALWMLIRRRRAKTFVNQDSREQAPA